MLNSPISNGNLASTPTQPKSQTPEYPGAEKAKKAVPKEVELSIVNWVEQQYRDMKQDRISLEMQWYINLAFYFGRQYVQPFYNRTNIVLGNKLVEPKAPPWRVRMVINRVIGVVRTELSKLTSQKPSVSVVPSSSDDRDYFAAQAGEQIWDSIYREKKLKAIIRRAVWWMCLTGTGYIKCYWDPDTVDTASARDPQGNPVDLKGDFCYTPVTPFHVLVPDLLEEEIENQPYVMHLQTRTMDWIRLNYPEYVDKIQPDAQEAKDILEDSFMNIMNGSSGQNIEKNKVVVVKEVWIKPGAIPQFPSGGMVTVAGKKLIQFVEEWPYNHKSYPFAKLSHIPTGKYYSQSTITDLLSPQKELNRTRSQILEAKNATSKPQLLAAQGSIDPSKITTQPGQVILYKPGYEKPQPLPVQPLPSYVLQEVDRLIQDINDISGQHEVSKGQTPPGITAATAISYLQEQDDSMLAPSYDSVEEAIEKIAFMTLSYIGQYWTVARVVKIVGEDGSFDAQAFMGSNLRDNTDIRVEGGSSLPTSKAAKQALITDWMKMGFITPQQGLEVLDMGGLNKLTDQIKIDTRQAQRENLKMAAVSPMDLEAYQMMKQEEAAIDPATGLPTNPKYLGPPDPMTGQPTAINPPIMIPVNTWDNHAVHVRKHNDFRKSQAFEALPDETKQLFEAHVQDHMNAMQFEVQQQMAMQGMQGGPPGGQPPGQESGPPPELPPMGGQDGATQMPMM